MQQKVRRGRRQKKPWLSREAAVASKSSQREAAAEFFRVKEMRGWIGGDELELEKGSVYRAVKHLVIDWLSNACRCP